MIDTLKIAKQLEAAHLSTEQAEAIATAIAEIASGALATKADLQGIEARLNEKIVGVRIDVIDRIETVNEHVTSVRDRINWAVIGVDVLTWLRLNRKTFPWTFMNTNLTEIGFVLDRSGSMVSMAVEAVGGFNAFLQSQKQLSGEANLTLVLFDHEYIVEHSRRPIKDVPALNDRTYVPRGSTALLDAIGRTINTMGERLDKTLESERPGKVIVAILTDGLENASQEFKPKQIRSMIEHQRDKYAWEFIYLGANQDAIEVGERMGIASGCAVTFNETPDGAGQAFAAVNQTVAAYRAGAADYAGHLQKAAKKSV